MFLELRHKKIYIPSHMRFLVWIAIFVMLVFGVALIIQGQMDLQNYQHQIKQIVKERTGRDIYIRGGVNVVLLPTPTIYVSGVELRDLNEGKPVPAVTVELLLITPTIESLFSDKLQVASVAMENPSLEVERSSDNLIYWDWLEKEIFELLETGDPASSIAVDINGGMVIYRNSVTGRKVQVSDINISGTTGGVPNFSGDLSFNDRRFNIRATSNNREVEPGFIPLSVSFSMNDDNYIQLDGAARISRESMDIKGKLEVDIKDLYPWITFQNKKKKTGFEEFLQGSKSKETSQAILPVKFSGQWDQSGNKVTVSDVKWEGLASEGNGGIAMDFSKTIDITSSLHFSSLDYSKWRTLIQIVSDQLSVSDEKSYVIDESLHENILPEDIKLAFNLSSDKMLVDGQEWNKLHLDLGMEDAALTINQFFVEMPGEATLAVFGVISQSATTRGMRFEGSVETVGDNIKETLSIFDASVNDLPDMGFNKYFIRSNVYVSNDQIRLSESDVRFGELQLGGGLVIYYDATNPRIEADVRLQDTNFDYFRDLWRSRQDTKKKDSFFLEFDKSISFNWLKRLDPTIDLKINVERFRFLDREGDSAYLRLFARQGELGIYNVRFYYPHDTMEMNLTLNVQGEKPLVNLVLNASQVDTAYFSPLPPATDEEEREAEEASRSGDKPSDEATANIMSISPQSQELVLPAQHMEEAAPSDISVGSVTSILDQEKNKQSQHRKWSEELIDMSWMEGFNGAFDITIGRLVHGDRELSGIKMRGNLANSVLVTQGLGFSYWGGSCEITGSMYGGKVPGISVSYTLYNVELKEMLGSLFGYNTISGKASVSGTLSTSGVNYLSWLSQAEAKMAVSGRGVRVNHFDLDGVVNTVQVSRTAADVLNNVNRTLVRGSTRMTVDGVINANNGVLRSPGLTLKSGTILGSLTGDISVVPWTMDLAMLFQFPSISSETIPTLLVQLNGSIDDPALTTDTSSLEAYVVKSIKQK